MGDLPGLDAATPAGPDASSPDVGTFEPPDAGAIEADAATPELPDATTPYSPDAASADDAGAPAPGPDAGSVVVDAGTPYDAGTTPFPLPSSAGWTFYGAQQGGPKHVNQVAMDDNGNLWVAGGEEGLFVLTPGASSFRQLTMADGLRPYGYMPDGSEPVGTKYLNVLSVAGGQGSSVYVGYQGKPVNGNDHACEGNWDSRTPDPSVYKSGDADRVTLNGSGGINVVHYDIFSGPGIVRDELRGREKLCNILRIVYDRGNGAVWFGANHGFAKGDPFYAGNPTCNGQLACSGLMEHVHPAINAYSDDQKTSSVYLTGDYWGVAPDPYGDVWFGGINRTTKFKYTSAGGYWKAQSATEGTAGMSNRYDVWPDQVAEPTMPTPSQRKDDAVSGIAALSDGTVWVGSWYWGLAHLGSGGGLIGYVNAANGGLMDDHVYSVTRDPTDDSVWIGAGWGGLTRMKGGNLIVYGKNVFGPDLITSPVLDIQHAGSGATRKMLVAFRGSSTRSGAVGVYTGQ